MTDAELDARFAALRDVAPPEALTRRTLARVAEERSREQTPLPVSRPGGWVPRVPERRWILPAAALVIVAVNVAVLDALPEVASPDQLVPKGVGDPAPTLDVRAAVRHAGSVERLAAGARYAAGDTVLFRVTTSAPTSLRLFRDDLLLWTGSVPAGVSELPVGYTLEAGESAATFRVESETGARATVPVEAVAP